MIPVTILNSEYKVQDDLPATRTYKILDNKIQGYADNLEALEQAIYKVLNTEKYEYPIYSFSYGIELESLIGKDVSYAEVQLKRKIKECLLADERINSVENFNFIVTGDEILCTFDVTSIYGTITITREVNV